MSDAVQASGKRGPSQGAEGCGGAAKKLRIGAGSASIAAEVPEPAAAKEAARQQDAASVRLTVCRDGAVLLARVGLATEDGLGTNSLVHFCGAQVQVRPVIVCWTA